MSTRHNEKAKLTATFLNNLGVAVIVAGCAAPLFSVLYGMARLTDEQVRLILIAAPVWFLVGVVIHSLGSIVLDGVRGEP